MIGNYVNKDRGFALSFGKFFLDLIRSVYLYLCNYHTLFYLSPIYLHTLTSLRHHPKQFLSVCLSVCLSICLSVSLSVCMPISLSLSLSLSLYLSLSLSLSISLSLSLSFFLFSFAICPRSPLSLLLSLNISFLSTPPPETRSFPYSL